MARTPTALMLGLLLPFLVADLLLGWMLIRVWRSQETWTGMRMATRDEDRAAWWMQVARLAALLALSLTGTVATLTAG